MGTLFGFAVGYILGARVGNPGYERLRDAWIELRSSREFREFFEAARTHVQGTLRVAADRIADGDRLVADGEDLLARARARLEGTISTDPR